MPKMTSNGTMNKYETVSDRITNTFLHIGEITRR